MNKRFKSLYCLARQEIERLNAQSKLFVSQNDSIIEQVFESLDNASIRTVGPEIILAKYTMALGLIK
jgi:hypothetical protein